MKSESTQATSRKWRPEGAPTRSFTYMVGLRQESSLLKDFCSFSVFSKKIFERKQVIVCAYSLILSGIKEHMKEKGIEYIQQFKKVSTVSFTYAVRKGKKGTSTSTSIFAG